MITSPVEPGRRVPLYRLALIAAAILVLGPGAVAASAHAELSRAVPAVGSTVSKPPSQVRLTFSEPIQAIPLPVITVTGPDETHLGVGRVAVVGDTASVALDPLTSSGTYQVAWRVVSTDGHPSNGTFSFTVTDAAIDQSVVTDSGRATHVTLDDSRSWAARHTLVLLLGAGLLALGCLLWWAEGRRPDQE